MKAIINVPILLITVLFRVIFVGILSGLFCVYTVDYLVSSSFGTFNLVIITVYFATICTFSVVFIEAYYFFQRKTKKKVTISKDKEKYALK